MRVVRTLLRLLGTWLASPRVGLSEKVTYLARVVRFALSPGRKEIVYLGQRFCFDSVKTPLILMRYPQDVGSDLLDNAGAPIKTVLDIGGNIGQFAVTLLHYLPDLEALDVFEANPNVLALLGKNLSAKPQARVHPVGVGKAGSRSLFYVPGASGTGSFEHNRAIHTGSSTSKKSEIEVSVDVVDNVAALTGRDHYDLVKIDVEGAEFEVLSQLDVSMRYLWIELSGRRFGDVNHHTSELYEIIRGRFGEFDILFHSRWDAGSTCDVLIEIAEKPAVVS